MWPSLPAKLNGKIEPIRSNLGSIAPPDLFQSGANRQDVRQQQHRLAPVAGDGDEQPRRLFGTVKRLIKLGKPAGTEYAFGAAYAVTILGHTSRVKRSAVNARSLFNPFRTRRGCQWLGYGPNKLLLGCFGRKGEP